MKNKMKLGFALIVLSISSFAWSATRVYVNCELTSGKYKYVSTCKEFESVDSAMNFCDNDWYKIIGSPRLTHVRSLTISDSNKTLVGCNKMLDLFMKRNIPYSDFKTVISTRGEVKSFRMNRDVFSEDRMPSDI